MAGSLPPPCGASWPGSFGTQSALQRQIVPGFATFTLLTVIGPVAWFDYNHVYGHDWLDFMRGPYSAKEIDRKTSPPGAHKYWGWHNPAWSLMLYARTAQVDSTAWEFGWLVAAGSLYAAWKAWYSRLDRAAFLLWLPLPFYVVQHFLRLCAHLHPTALSALVLQLALRHGDAAVPRHLRRARTGRDRALLQRARQPDG